MAKKRKTRNRRLPWSILAGLLVGSFSTLVGVSVGIEPITILLRSAVSAIVAGVAISIGLPIIELANSKSGTR